MEKAPLWHGYDIVKAKNHEALFERQNGLYIDNFTK